MTQPDSHCSCTTQSEDAACSCTEDLRTSHGIRMADSRITAANRLDHFLARWGVNRGGHRVAPGVYRLGNPGPGSPVFASANYTLSFDALRSAISGVDAYILVLDTRGINVWCAAGKGTFGTDELVRQIGTTGPFRDRAATAYHRPPAGCSRRIMAGRPAPDRVCGGIRPGAGPRPAGLSQDAYSYTGNAKS